MQTQIFNALPVCDQELICLIEDDGSMKDEVSQQDYDAALEAMWTDFFASPIGQIMKENYTDDSLYGVDQIYKKDYGNAIYGWRTILSHRLQAVIHKMHSAGDPRLVLKDSKKPRAAASARPARPQDPKTGAFLSDVEIEARADLNGDARQFVIDEKRRVRSDYRLAYDYAKFQLLGIAVQRSTKPGIEWEPLVPPKPTVTSDIQAFARAWKNTPTKNLHAIAGIVTLADGSEFTVAQYEDNLNRAAAQGAI